MFLGDSITDSEHCRDGGNNLGYGYTSMVSAYLGYEYPGEYTFHNSGISGSRSIDLYARLKSDAVNLNAEYISILIGVNDVLMDFKPENNGIDAQKYFKIYSLIIEELKRGLPGVKIMILEPFVLKGSETEENYPLFRNEIEKRAEISFELAKSQGIPFIRLQHLFDEATKRAPASYWLSDGIHPTVAGHEIIKREWINAFEKLAYI